MKRIASLLLFILFCAALTTSARCAEKQGTEKNPFKGKGPINQWVTNGKWMMRVTAVQSVDTMEAAEGLPWTKRLTRTKKETIWKWLERLYKGEGKLILVTVEAKNLGDKKISIGVPAPRWRIRTDDGQQSKAGDCVDKGKMSPGGSSGIAADIAFCLQGGFPQDEKLNPGAKTSGKIPMAIPSYAEAKLFYFFSVERERDFGKNESLVIDLLGK